MLLELAPQVFHRFARNPYYMDNVFATLDTPYAHAVRYIEIEFSYNEILKGMLKLH